MIAFFSQIPHALAVFLIAMLPVTELRGAIPVGLEIYKMPVVQVWLLAVAGNAIPAILALYILPFLRAWIISKKTLGAVFTKLLTSAEKKYHRFEKFGPLGLIVFTGTPIPLFGAYTGVLAALVVGMPFKKSVWPIIGGMIVAATVVTLLTLGVGAVK